MAGLSLLSAVGKTLRRHDVDVDGAALELRQQLALPEGLQYLWPHPHRPFLYAACSDGRPGRDGGRHFACVLARRPDGMLALHGEPLPLPVRPVHLSIDAAGRHVVLTSPKPSRIAVHPILDDGRLGAELPQPPMPALAKMAHQALFTPDGRRLVVPLRGNPPHDGSSEDPGAIAVFDYDDGRLVHRQTIAPEGGHGFGPRHVAFHPGRPWMYLSIERQNQLALFRLGESIEGPVVRIDSLRSPDRLRPRQLGGAIHVHPGGRFVYMSNRADGTIEVDGRQVFNDGENSIAVFAIDPDDGMPRLIQHADSHGIHPRTFHIDPSGRLLVAANMTTRLVRDGGTVREQPGGLSLFRIGSDGRLSFVRSEPADTARDHLFWAGMVQAA